MKKGLLIVARVVLGTVIFAVVTNLIAGWGASARGAS